MTDSPFEQPYSNAALFPIPQNEEVLEAVVNDVGNFRLLVCVTGFPKGGKTVFAERLGKTLNMFCISFKASSELTLSQALRAKLATLSTEKTSLSEQLKNHKRVVLIIDNAQLLNDEDLAFMSGLFTLAEQSSTVLQVVLVGNGEIVQRISRPDNRTIYNMLSNIWSLPRLTREQGYEFVHFLLDAAGISRDVIPNPAPLIKRAGGSIGILRTLTVTLALKALSGQEISEVDDLLALNAQLSSDAQDGETEPAPVYQEMVSPQSRWAGKMVFVSMGLLIAVFLLIFALTIPGFNIRQLVSGGNQNRQNATVAEKYALPKSTQAGEEELKDAAQNSSKPLPVAKTVFRKRTKDGPYSIHLGSYATIDGMLLNMQRYLELKQPILWDRAEGTPVHYDLYAGRFDDLAQANQFAAEQKLASLPVVFRPFMVTAGPLADAEQYRTASALLGLPEPQETFARELVAGRELQFALERTQDEAMQQCRGVEAKGLSCAVTLYE